MRKRLLGGAVAAAAVALVVACGSSRDDLPDVTGDGGASGDDGGNPFVSTGDGGLPTGDTRDPVDCNEAATSHSYVGCDYWPTVNANIAWSIFDFAVVVANTGTTTANVTVTGGTGVNTTDSVPPGTLKKIYLPWVSSLKGADMNECGTAVAMTASVRANGGAYHLVSSSPVIVYQFSALEYKGAGGPAGKSWSQCPGTTTICDSGDPRVTPAPIGCFAFTNDATILLPSTAMTGNYRITGMHGWTESTATQTIDATGPHFTVTGTQDGTDVTVKLAAAGKVLAGGGLSATNGGGTLTFSVNAGDVVEVVAPKGKAQDFSGSLVQATKPVQVITGIPCINVPQGKRFCDHLESSVLPAETLGTHYFVAMPTSPSGETPGHVVRFYGNVDGTNLTYLGAKPPACPTTLSAGQVVDCGVVTNDFEVKGDHEFGVDSFQLGSELVDFGNPQNPRGDPSQSAVIAVEQYRTKYLFLAPDDYDVSYVDVVGTLHAAPVLDGQELNLADWKATIGSDFGVWRTKLGPGQAGAHTLTATEPVSAQVEGYGSQTSYGYPAGLNAKLISAPPVK